MDQLLKAAVVKSIMNDAREDGAKAALDSELKAILLDKTSKLNEREKGIMHMLFQIGASCRFEAYVTGNKKLFMKNVKAFIKKHKISGPTITFQPTFNEVMRTIKKLERIDLMKIDEDGLPLWGGKEVLAKAQAMRETRYGK